MKARWTNFLVCLSLANLLFLRSWEELLRYREQMPSELTARSIQSLFAGTVFNVLITAAIFWGAIYLVDRFQNRRLLLVAQCAFLAIMITPLDILGWNLYTYLRPYISPVLLKSLWTVLLLVPVLGCVLLLLYRNHLLLRLARNFALVVAPLFPVTTATLAWAIHTAPATEVAPAQPVDASIARRVVWMIFDEMDQRIVFNVRPESVHMPEVDRLRSESFFALNARPPAGETSESIASLISGKLVRKTQIHQGQVMLEVSTGEHVDLSQEPTVFTRARQAGFNTGLVGWWLPYCAVLGHTLTGCAEPRYSDIRPVEISENMAAEWKEHLEQYWLVTRFSKQGQYRVPWCGWGERKDQLRAYKYIRAQVLAMVTDPTIQFVFVHWPVPHPLGIYDRYEDDYSLDLSANYLDNLELTDRSVGEVRHALQQAGLWDATSLLVSSDHPFRPDAWENQMTWTEEENAISQGRRFPSIPFILKLAGQRRPVEYKPVFNTIVTGDLMLAILKGEVRTGRDVVEWLEQGRKSIPSAVLLAHQQ